ncbi:MAG: hypothetical protein IJ914_10500, partial [Prevotella sp.]|nr:hypothetical protein [Prevotella sp.]
VYRIAMNTCITFLRRSNARPHTVPMTANVASMAADEDTSGQLKELYRLINQLGKLERAARAAANSADWCSLTRRSAIRRRCG